MPPHAPCWWRWVSTPMSWHGTRSLRDGSEPTSPARTGPLETLGSGKIRSQRISQGLNVPTVSPTGGIAAGVPRVVRLPMGPAVRHRDASRGVAEVRAGETSANFRQGVVKDGTGWDRGSGTDPGDDAKSLPPPPDPAVLHPPTRGQLASRSPRGGPLAIGPGPKSAP